MSYRLPARSDLLLLLMQRSDVEFDVGDAFAHSDYRLWILGHCPRGVRDAYTGPRRPLITVNANSAELNEA